MTQTGDSQGLTHQDTAYRLSLFEPQHWRASLYISYVRAVQKALQLCWPVLHSFRTAYLSTYHGTHGYPAILTNRLHGFHPGGWSFGKY